MITTVASFVSGAIGIGIILIGARFLVAPQVGAAGFGVAAAPCGDAGSAEGPYPWLYANGLRDIASGLFLLILLLAGTPHLLGAFMVAASLIPIGDAMIVLRSGGTRAAAYGIHGVTAAVILAAGVALLAA